MKLVILQIVQQEVQLQQILVVQLQINKINERGKGL
jgi:hypothetical protein